MTQPVERRTVLKHFAAAAAAAFAAPAVMRASSVQAQTATISPRWKAQVGFELFTVQSDFIAEPEKTLAAVSALGIKEVEPRVYAGLSPSQFRALLDRHGLTAPSTHEFSVPGPGLEKDLEGLQVMGIKYARFPLPGETPQIGGRGRGAPADGRQSAAAPTARGGAGRGAAAAATMQETPEFMRRVAADLNAQGRIAQRFGIKALYHNHTTEFQRYPGEPLLPYEVLLRETDPAVVAMQIDLGWASVAGQDIVRLFEQYPGRFELWHI
jgi:sugar phosphate isomerase/epimerase